MTSINNHSSVVRSQSADTAQVIHGELQSQEVARAAELASEQAPTLVDPGRRAAHGEAGLLYTGGVAEPVRAYNVNAQSVTRGASLADLGTVNLSGGASRTVDGGAGSAQLVATSEALTASSSAGPTSSNKPVATSAVKTTSTSSLGSSATQLNDIWLTVQKAMAEETSSLSGLRKALKTGWENLRKKSEELIKAQESLENVKVGKHGRGRAEQEQWRNTINELKRDIKELVESLSSTQKSLEQGVTHVKALAEQGKELAKEAKDLKDRATEELAEGTIDKATLQNIEKLAKSMESDRNFINADKTIADYQALSDANKFDPAVLFLACTWNEGAHLDGTTLTAQAWQAERRYTGGGFGALFGARLSVGDAPGIYNDYKNGSTGVSSGGTGVGTYDVGNFGSNALAFMDYLDSYERAIDIGSNTIGIASDRYARNMKT